MNVSELGHTTLHTRVEQWEADFNNHWNLRFYVRSFQLAAETVTTLAGGVSPGASLIRCRHMRFHRELFANAPVEVRSMTVADGPHAGATVHVLASEGRLSATAMDSVDGPGTELPAFSSETLAFALPRGISGEPASSNAAPWTEPMPMGPTRPAEYDHTGALLWEEVIRRLAFTSHLHIARVGYTPAFVQQSGINRMSVEMRIDRLGEVPVGSCLLAESRLVAVGGKSFSTEHRIESDSGIPLALVRQNLLAVDLSTRRAVEVPEFLRTALT